MENKIKSYLIQNVLKLTPLQDKFPELESKFENIESESFHGKLPRKIRECPKTIHHFTFIPRNINSHF